MQTKLIYNFRNLYNIKIQAMFSNLLVQLNNPGLLGCTTLIRVHQLQSDLFLHKYSLEYWPCDISKGFRTVLVPYYQSYLLFTSHYPSIYLENMIYKEVLCQYSLFSLLLNT